MQSASANAQYALNPQNVPENVSSLESAQSVPENVLSFENPQSVPENISSLENVPDTSANAQNITDTQSASTETYNAHTDMVDILTEYPPLTEYFSPDELPVNTFIHAGNTDNPAPVEPMDSPESVETPEFVETVDSPETVEPMEPLTEHSEAGTEPLAPPPELLAPSFNPVPELPWNLRLINLENLLPDGYQPPELASLPNGHAVDSRVYPALERMLTDAREAGYDPVICSSFRSMQKQVTLFSRRTRTFQRQGYSLQRAQELAGHWVARPGSSEHEAGLALDIVDRSYQLLEREQENTPAQQWLMAHCAEYGFILRYPDDKTEITGIGYEPWHYRYVGEKAAREMTDNGLCLEEYIDLWFSGEIMP